MILWENYPEYTPRVSQQSWKTQQLRPSSETKVHAKLMQNSTMLNMKQVAYGTRQKEIVWKALQSPKPNPAHSPRPSGCLRSILKITSCIISRTKDHFFFWNQFTKDEGPLLLHESAANQRIREIPAIKIIAWLLWRNSNHKLRSEIIHTNSPNRRVVCHRNL